MISVEVLSRRWQGTPPELSNLNTVFVSVVRWLAAVDLHHALRVAVESPPTRRPLNITDTSSKHAEVLEL
jgi:hypothetical protein